MWIISAVVVSAPASSEACRLRSPLRVWLATSRSRPVAGAVDRRPCASCDHLLGVQDSLGFIAQRHDQFIGRHQACSRWRARLRENSVGRSGRLVLPAAGNGPARRGGRGLPRTDVPQRPEHAPAGRRTVSPYWPALSCGGVRQRPGWRHAGAMRSPWRLWVVAVHDRLVAPRKAPAKARHRVEQPARFELHDDRRPAGERSATERYAAPSLFSLLDEG
jgi:hypothetical protein